METCVIEIRQNPCYAGVSTLADNAPHYLEPAPVVEIRGIRSSAADPEQLAMSITLIDSKTGFELNTYRDRIGHPQPYLTGTVVSPTYHVRAEGGTQVQVFLFPEIKVWVAGRFRLRFSLFENYRDKMQLCHVTLSCVFPVHPSHAYPGKLAPTELDRALASQNVRQRIYKQPVIRRCKSPGSEDTPPVVVPHPFMALIPGLPLPPPLRKIPAKGEAKRRYASSTPASRCLNIPAQTRQRLSRPPSRMYERPALRLPEMLIETGSPSPPPSLDAVTDHRKADNAHGINALADSAKTSPFPSTRPQPNISTSPERLSKTSDKMALRNLLT